MTDRTVHVGNLETFVDESTLYLLFSQFGTISNVRFAGAAGMNTRYAFVEFADSAMANTACLLDGLQVGGRNLRVAMAKPSGQGSQTKSSSSSRPARQVSAEDAERMTRTVHIRGIDAVVTEAYLIQYFSVCGPISGARLTATGNPKVGWLEFTTREGAAAALQLDGQQLGSQILRVSPSKSAIQTNSLAPKPAPAPIPTAAAAAQQQQELAAALQLQTAAMQTLLVQAAAASVRVSGISAKTRLDNVKSFFEGSCGKVRSVKWQVEPQAPITTAETAAGTEKDTANGPAPSEEVKKVEEGKDGETGENGKVKAAAAADKDSKAAAAAVPGVAVVEFEAAIAATAVAAAVSLVSPTIGGVVVKVEKIEPPPSAPTLPPNPSVHTPTPTPSLAAVPAIDPALAPPGVANYAPGVGVATYTQPGVAAAPAAALGYSSHAVVPTAAAAGPGQMAGYDWSAASQVQYGAGGYEAALPPGVAPAAAVGAAQQPQQVLQYQQQQPLSEQQQQPAYYAGSAVGTSYAAPASHYDATGGVKRGVTDPYGGADKRPRY